VSLPSLLRDAGYHTYMAGKWHLGGAPGQLPNSRGFEKSFALVGGGAGHFGDAAPLFENVPTRYVEDGADVSIPEDFYSTRFYTDKLLTYLRESEGDGRPFFAYAAFTAPHWPLQVPDDFLDRYRGVYDEGYDHLREQRVMHLVEQGVVPADTTTPERLPWVRGWESLTAEERKIEARRMEIYAAMVDYLDASIGRLLDHLRETGQYENTLILFFSDNGAEGNRIGAMYSNPTWLAENFDLSYANMGRIGSYVWTGAAWAQAQTAPFRLFKTFATEGGIRVPAIVKQVGGRRGQRDDFASVKDVAPTLLELAGVEHPSTYRGREVAPLEGTSWASFLAGDSDQVHVAGYTMGWELFGRRSIYQDGWKIVALWEPYGSESWTLYDLARDPGEADDLSKQYPEKLEELLAKWDDYARENGVILPTHDTGYGLVEEPE
jgi:arylsulfatase A-like enzyme